MDTGNACADHMPRPPDQIQSLLSSLRPPYIFNPSLGFREALVFITGSLTRIFGTCVLFAVLGCAILIAWTTIQNDFLRAVAVLSLALLLLGAVTVLMIAVSMVERALTTRTRT
jgi:hypothetical protein